jgi:hypothetical protein
VTEADVEWVAVRRNSFTDVQILPFFEAVITSLDLNTIQSFQILFS